MGIVTIHKTITFYECFGCVTIVKTIHYCILECACIVHVFWNVEFGRKFWKKTASMPSMPQSVITNTIFFRTSFFSHLLSILLDSIEDSRTYHYSLSDPCSSHLRYIGIQGSFLNLSFDNKLFGVQIKFYQKKVKLLCIIVPNHFIQKSLAIHHER